LLPCWALVEIRKEFHKQKAYRCDLTNKDCVIGARPDH